MVSQTQSQKAGQLASCSCISIQRRIYDSVNLHSRLGTLSLAHGPCCGDDLVFQQKLGGSEYDKRCECTRRVYLQWILVVVYINHYDMPLLGYPQHALPLEENQTARPPIDYNSCNSCYGRGNTVTDNAKTVNEIRQDPSYPRHEECGYMARFLYNIVLPQIESVWLISAWYYCANVLGVTFTLHG